MKDKLQKIKDDAFEAIKASEGLNALNDERVSSPAS